MISLTSERPEDSASIEHLLDLAFGLDRRRKTSYRYREGVAEVAWLSTVARRIADDALVGSIRYWPLRVVGQSAGEQPGPGLPDLLLGPLAVDPGLQGCGIGRALMFRTLDMACWAHVGRVFLVGDIDYYAKFGFAPAAPRGYHMPGENPARLLMRDFGHLGAGTGGVLMPARPDDAPAFGADPAPVREAVGSSV